MDFLTRAKTWSQTMKVISKNKKTKTITQKTRESFEFALDLSVRLYGNNFEDANIQVVGESTNDADAVVNVHQNGNGAHHLPIGHGEIDTGEETVENGTDE